jgi:SPP1 family predicted phage head-tail adaptor
MSYSAGMMNKRIKIARRVTGTTPTAATDTGKARYEILATVWAAETWNKGAKAMQAGALDVYDTVMFRMRYRSDVDRWCLLQYHGKWYQIQSLNGDYHENQLQITATEMPNQKVNIVEPTPEPTPDPTPETPGTVNPEPENEG